MFGPYFFRKPSKHNFIVPAAKFFTVSSFQHERKLGRTFYTALSLLLELVRTNVTSFANSSAQPQFLVTPLNFGLVYTQVSCPKKHPYSYGMRPFWIQL